MKKRTITEMERLTLQDFQRSDKLPIRLVLEDE